MPDNWFTVRIERNGEADAPGETMLSTSANLPLGMERDDILRFFIDALQAQIGVRWTDEASVQRMMEQQWSNRERLPKEPIN